MTKCKPYYCPTSESLECCPEHSGFGVCCDNPQFHVPEIAAPVWVELPNGSRYCQNCMYTNTCRCMWCPRCEQLTGNTTQGHFWAFCKVTGKDREFHMCCPGDCELEAP